MDADVEEETLIGVRYVLFVVKPDMHLKKRLYMHTNNLYTLIICIIYTIYSLYAKICSAFIFMYFSLATFLHVYILYL